MITNVTMLQALYGYMGHVWVKRCGSPLPFEKGEGEGEGLARSVVAEIRHRYVAKLAPHLSPLPAGGERRKKERSLVLVLGRIGTSPVHFR